MHNESFFFQAFIYLSAAVISVPIAKRLGLGSVLGYLLAGVVIGPFVLGLIGAEGQDVMHFAEFGVVMMLFLIGLELQPSLLWKLRGPILGLGGLQVGATALLIGTVALLFGLPWQSALAIGLILALSSTAIVLQTLAEKGWMKTHGGQSSFSVLLFQDIAVIPMLAILPLLALPELAGGLDHALMTVSAGNATTHAAGTDISYFDTWPAWGQTLGVLLAVAIIILAGRFFVRPMLRAIAQTRMREAFTAAALFLIIGIALLMDSVGLSPALGTFLAGVVLADSEYRHELESNIEPFKGLLLGLFFISVGASIDFNLVASQPGTIAGLVAGLIGIKLLVLHILARVFKLSLNQNLLFTFSLAQGGEFGFVLFSFATQHRVLPTSVVEPLVVTVALSMALTPLIILAYDKVIRPRIGTKEAVERPMDDMHEENPVIIAGYGHYGNIVGRFLQANGVTPTVLDYDSDRVELLRNIGLTVFYGDASRHDLLESAGANEAKILVIAVDEPDTVLAIIHTAQKHFPHLKLMVRARSWTDSRDLFFMGMENVYRENLDTSLRVGVDVLRALGYRGHRVHRAAFNFRAHDEKTLRELSMMTDDRKKYTATARQRIREVEEILLKDHQASEEVLDLGWDVSTLRDEINETVKDKR
jgi:glutathione-regulated potassium-efflux system protein KefB